MVQEFGEMERPECEDLSLAWGGYSGRGDLALSGVGSP